MWFHSSHANIYVSKREARSEGKSGFGCDTGFGARDGVYSWLCRSLSCNLEPVTFTSVPAAAHLLQLMRTPFFCFCISCMGAASG